jgi:hypothetical protein
MPWIMLTDSFLSIVADPVRKDTLAVRARARGDIERVFPKAKVVCLPNRDYAFRAHLPRKVVADAIAKRVLDTPEMNFKGSTLQHDRHDAYVRCWQAMADFQESRGHGRPYETTATGKGRKLPKGRNGRGFTSWEANSRMGGDLPFPPLPGDTMADLDEAEAKWLADRDDTMDFDGPAHRKG